MEFTKSLGSRCLVKKNVWDFRNLKLKMFSDTGTRTKLNWKILSLGHMFTVKNFRRFYGKMTGNQLPVYFALFFTGARKHFQKSGTER